MGLSNIGYLVIGMFAIAAVVFALRSNVGLPNKGTIAGTKKPGASKKPPSRKRNSYLATAIVGGDNMCDAVRAIEDKRFLVADKDIPQLPLLNCDAAKCTCTYAHFEDRRDDGDRRGPIGLRSELHKYVGQLEKRAKRGRRASDWE